MNNKQNNLQERVEKLRSLLKAAECVFIGDEEYFVNTKGESRISYADYAIAMIDEIENANNIQKRFSVIGK
ncbi:MAG TPA: hypothetical protein IAB07_02840 [Candidatus Caccalectryoclostridium excrementigallinarum]|uniref:Uncharacterized protein n=1 Tax=Candidatus Caccalectryoclostridium excrementigallinarum TaxID=2840710 RepID=A0A9D1SJY6_9FIRM|nr:hypothetical protein [Candidatus Caccalectryoclostridium excrementigallinarum]